MYLTIILYVVGFIVKATRMVCTTLVITRFLTNSNITTDRTESCFSFSTSTMEATAEKLYKSSAEIALLKYI